jgi:formylglycine-generating enzyme required for sulfatase activity
MSRFNKKLDQAKVRQKKIYMTVGATALAIFLVLALLFFIPKGTRVEITPKDAQKNARLTIARGLGIFMGDRVYSIGKNMAITAFAPGFKAKTVPIAPEYLGKVLPLELFELPGHLLVEIAGQDDLLQKTSWQIKGHDIGFSPSLDLELEAGSYIVIVNNPFFQLKRIEAKITRGELTRLQVALLPVDGRMNISSKPSGAAVFLDNKKMGLTPLRFDQKGGQYDLRLVLKNHIETLEQLSITRATPEVNRNYNISLEKAGVSLDLTPVGGTLLVNGKQMSKPIILDATLAHPITYMKAGFYSETQTITLQAGEHKLIAFHLKAETGRVEILSSPRAGVWIDGKEAGVTPVSRDLSAVPHTITLKKPGYRSVSKVVKPKGNAVQKVSVSLPTEYQARLREAPREFTNKAGVKLKLYVVQDGFTLLTMGAPRSEKGQRANEFLRKISLTKSFYASLFEITNRQFAKFNPGKAKGPANKPVTAISWQEAAAFCNWLSTQEQKKTFYQIANGKVTGFDRNADGYRLLSEGEWEWLARKAGKKKQTLFAWGDARVMPPKTANVADESARGQVKFFVPNYKDGYAGIAPVGSFDKEPSGLYDMAGNVSEWVHDIYLILPPRGDTIEPDPLGKQQGYSHVVKGANWRSGTITTLRPAFREGETSGRDDIGFRIGRYLYGGKNE